MNANVSNIVIFLLVELRPDSGHGFPAARGFAITLTGHVNTSEGVINPTEGPNVRRHYQKYTVFDLENPRTFNVQNQILRDTGTELFKTYKSGTNGIPIIYSTSAYFSHRHANGTLPTQRERSSKTRGH